MDVTHPNQPLICDPQAYHGANSSQPDKATKQNVAVSTSLNGFAEFLVKFNINTVRAMEARLRKFDTALESAMRSIMEGQRQYGTRIMDYMLRNFQDAMMEAAKTVFAAESFRKDEGVAKAVLDALLRLEQRLEGVQRQNGASKNTLQVCLESMNERLSNLETAHTSTLTTIINNQSSSSTSFFSDSSNHPVFAAIAGQVEELGCMFDQLSKRVDAARDEAHQDKEELAQLFDETHKNLAFGLQAELRALKNAVDVGKGCLKASKSDGTPISLAGRLESLAMDYQGTMDYFKDAEVTREDTSYLNVEQSLEEVRNLVQANAKTEKSTRDAAVLTDSTEEVITERSDSNGSDSRRKVLTDATAQTECSSIALSVDNLDISTGDAPDADQGPRCLEPQLLCQIQDVFRNPIAANYAGSPPLPQTRHRFISPFGDALTLDTNMLRVSEQPPPGIQARRDPATSLLFSPSSAVFRSMGTALKRKADAVDIQHGEDAGLGLEKANELQTIGDVSNFDIGGPLSPNFAEDRAPEFDLDRFSPLTEDDLDSPDEDDVGVDNPSLAGAANSLPANLSGSLPSMSGKVSSEISDGCEPALKAKTIDPLAARSTIERKHGCPHKCGTSYTHRTELRRHLNEGRGSCLMPKERYWCSNDCGRSYASKQGMQLHLKKCLGTENTYVPVSVKRRKVAEGEAEASARNSSGMKRRTLPKSNGPGGKYVHSREILAKCKWPLKTMVNETFDHQLLQCDRCDSHYHYRCVGVAQGDERLTPEGAFICPPCGYINDTPVNKAQVCCCGRPDCDWPGEASDNDNDYFIVERILGRSALLNMNGERPYLWLVKWHGYDIKDCTWEEDSALPNADKLINKFYAFARREGMKIVEDCSLYLLREARTKLQLAMKKKWKWAS